MHKLLITAFSLSVVAGSFPASAETIIQNGNLPVATFTQCSVGATYTLNTRAQVLSRGGWQIAPTAGAGGDGTQWSRTYNNSVFVAQRRLRSLPYTYLAPNDGTGAGC